MSASSTSSVPSFAASSSAAVSPVPSRACTVMTAKVVRAAAPEATRAASFTPRGRSDQSERAIGGLPVLRLTGGLSTVAANFGRWLESLQRKR
jgi:hypothetical protein